MERQIFEAKNINFNAIAEVPGLDTEPLDETDILLMEVISRVGRAQNCPNVSDADRFHAQQVGLNNVRSENEFRRSVVYNLDGLSLTDLTTIDRLGK